MMLQYLNSPFRMRIYLGDKLVLLSQLDLYLSVLVSEVRNLGCTVRRLPW